jgi:hypothetical protein
MDEFDRLVHYSPGAVPINSKNATPVPSNDIIGNVEHTKFSYRQAAERCPALAQAAQREGRDTSYPVWILATKTADLSIEGREFAHSISCGHPEYDMGVTDKTIGSLTGGPAGCAAWDTAYGTGGPCDSCEFKGQIKNPAVQLGALVETTLPGSAALEEPKPVPSHIAELNERFALVRHGTKHVVVDFLTPSMTGHGVAHGLGFFDVPAFRSMLNARFVPGTKAGEKQVPLSSAWLVDTGRRQYEGLVFAPPPVMVPPTLLNLWQGFAVPPIPGNVLPWLRLLVALVTGKTDRLYVLRWLAWKVQNPGGVPDTLLILKGAKGTGKNSLFDPLIMLFGRHAMLADDPELIAGRFTWHLMTLSFAVLDEAVFIQDPRQADRIKSRVTAKTMMYEQKGMDPVQGVNRCAFVMLTNHEYVWQATTDERRAVVIEVGEKLRGNLNFWSTYHAWAAADGPAALLHYLQSVDLTGFNPGLIPKGEALRKQVEQTALRDSAAAWWHQCLTEGAIRWRDGVDHEIPLEEFTTTIVDRSVLRKSYEGSAASKNRNRSASDWAAVAKKMNGWAGAAGIVKKRGKAHPTTGQPRGWVDELPPLPVLRAEFTAATQVKVA